MHRSKKGPLNHTDLNNSAKNTGTLDLTQYPVRSSCGKGKWENDELILLTQSPNNQHKISNFTNSIFKHCSGTATIIDIIKLIKNDHPGHSLSSLTILTCNALIELIDCDLISFSPIETGSIPIMNVRFSQFWADFNPEHNYFMIMMSKHMFVVISDNKIPDIHFVSDSRPDNKPTSSQIDLLTETCRNVFVSSSHEKPDLKKYDYAFSPTQVHSDQTDRHSQISLDKYMRTEPFLIDNVVAKQFYNFLFPINAEDFRFKVSHSESNPKTIQKHSLLEKNPDGDKNTLSSKIDDFYHIVCSTDSRQREGLFALINSIIKNTSTPEKYFLHILVDDHATYYTNILDDNFQNKLHYEVVSLYNSKHLSRHEEFLTHIIENRKSTRVGTSIMNFARFYLPEIFPNIKFGLYLDVDMIVKSDLAPLFKTELTSTIIASPLNRDLIDNYDQGLKLTKKGFNAGLLLIDFKGWRQLNVIQKIEKVMRRQKQRPFFKNGTQSILNIVFYKQCMDLDSKWNMTNLGYKHDLHPRRLEKAWILHWNGNHKPWLQTGMYKELWKPYQVPLPNFDYLQNHPQDLGRR
jgi:lipopolysaccharide biosynthesis glycosyltransferase